MPLKRHSSFKIMFALLVVVSHSFSFGQIDYKNYVDSLRSVLRESTPFDSFESEIKTMDDPLELGVAYMEWAYQLNGLGETEQAKDKFYKAAKSFSKIKKPDWDQHLRAYNNAIYLSNNTIEKLQLLQELNDLNPKDQYYVINSFNSTTSYLSSVHSDYQKALNLIDQAKLKYKDTDWEINPKFVDLIALEFDISRMIQNFDKKDELFSYWKKIEQKGAVPTVELYLGMGNYSKEMGDFSSAKNYYEQGLSLADENTSEAQVFLQNLGKTYLDLGELDQAKTIILKSLDSANGAIEQAQAENNFAYWQLLNQNYDQAISWYKKSFESFTGGRINARNQVSYPDDLSGDQEAEVYDYLEDIAEAYLQKAEGLASSNDYKNAIDYYLLTDQEIDKKRNQQIQQESRLFWRKKVKPIYEHALSAAYKTQNVEAFYQFHEKAKAVLLLNDLYINQQDELLKIRDQVAEIDLKLVEIQKNLTQNPSKELKSDELSLQETKDSLLYLINTTISAAQIIPLNQLKERIKPNTTLISYIETDSAYYGYVQQYQENISLFELPKKGQVNLNLKPGEKADKSILNQVFQQLIPTHTLNNQLIILPDGQLNFIPFEALVDNTGDYLIENHIISYGFSASTYFFDQIELANRPVFIFGPIRYADSLKLSPLLLTKKEIKSLRRFKGINFLNQDASKTNFLNSIGNQSVIHISSHGMANDINGYNHPWIAAYDQKIYLPELYNQQLHVNLVTLSACETNLGEQIQGEGTISLTRGFFHAGAESVISSLWQVNEKSTAEILNNYYRLINKGYHKAKALQLAKLDFAKKHPEFADAPYYWAGLIYYGQDDFLDLPKKKSQLPLVLLALFLVVGLVLRFRYLNRR